MLASCFPHGWVTLQRRSWPLEQGETLMKVAMVSAALFSRGDPGIPGVQTGITLRHGHQVTPENL